MSIAIDRSPQLVQYFGATKDIDQITNYTNIKTIFRIQDGGYQAWERANEGTDFNAFEQLENGVGYLIFSEDSAPSSYDLDSGATVTPPASTSVQDSIAIKQYQGSFDLSSSDPFRDNLSQLFTVDTDGNYQSWSKANEDTNFNSFNSLVSGETYLIFSDSTLTFPADDYAWATFTPGNKMYAVDPRNDRILILDTASHSVSSSIPCKQNPSDIIIDSEESLGYVLSYIGQTLQVLDLTTDTFVDEIFLYHSNAPYNFVHAMQGSDMKIYDDGTDKFLAISSVTSGSSVVVNLTTRSVESEVRKTDGAVVSNLLVSDPDDVSTRNLYTCDTQDELVTRYESKNNYQPISTVIGGFPDDRLGRIVSLSPNGEYLAVVRYNREVNVYKLVFDRWQKIGAVFVADTDYDSINSLYINNIGHVAIGILQTSRPGTTDIGAAVVYALDSSTKKYLATSPLLSANSISLDRFGFKVALSNDGSTLVVSAPRYGGIGAVFVYEYNAGSSTWSQKGDGIFAPVDVSITSSFGSSISITSNANRILVGCESKNQVYLYEYISNNWTQIAPPINSENDIAFGKHVKLDAGGTKALCVSNNLARVFEYDGSTSWSLHGNSISLVNGDVVRMSQDTNTIAIVNSINYNMDIYSYNSYNDYYAIDESLSFSAISSDLFAADVDISGDGALVSIGASGYVNNSGYVATYKKQ